MVKTRGVMGVDGSHLPLASYHRGGPYIMVYSPPEDKASLAHMGMDG